MGWRNTDNVDLSQIKDTGWCLSDVQNAMHAPHRFASAIEEWNNQTQFNHAGEAPPTTCYAPVYYGPHAENGGYGHVTIGTGNKAWFRGQCVDLHFTAAPYLGWSEATGGYPQVEYVADDNIKTGTVLVDGLRIRLLNNLNAEVVGYYNTGDTVRYDSTSVNAGYVWLHTPDGTYVAAGRDTGKAEDDDYVRLG